MPKCKDSFNSKFRMLCSQESHEEINWTSSESSDYENLSNCDKAITSSNKQNRKRKRKKKVPKNISNLDITIIDVANDKDSSRAVKKEHTSPILSSAYHPPYKCIETHTSPIICPKTINSQKLNEKMLKSPILVLKTASPASSRKVKKKLFGNTENIKNNHFRSNSAVLNYDGIKKNDDSSILRRHSICTEKINEELLKENVIDFGSEKNKNFVIKNKKAIKTEHKDNLNDSLESLNSMKDWNLVNKVKSYFDSHFSSESVSQVTIQDSLTPKSNSKTSKSSDDIEILNTITQINSNKNSTESVKEEIITDLLETHKSKKIRYKKDGLAYRLNFLLKKHNANISLWQHERFLAANSNFVIPKGEHLLFIIREVEIKYGCFLLHTKNIDNELFLILINNDYVNNSNICKDMVLKVYEPYKTLEFNEEVKLIINVCKFECEKLKDL